MDIMISNLLHEDQRVEDENVLWDSYSEINQVVGQNFGIESEIAMCNLEGDILTLNVNVDT